MEKVRESNFELLRILEMVAIVLVHTLSIYTDGKVSLADNLIEGHVELMALIRFSTSALGDGGVIIFAMLSGYFLIESQGDTLLRFGKNVTKFMGLTLFNGTLVMGVIVSVSWILMHLEILPQGLAKTIDFSKSILDDYRVTFGFQGGTWYLLAYSILLLVIRPMNNLLRRLQLAQFFYLIIALIIISGVANFSALIGINYKDGFPNVFIGYVIGAFLKKFQPLRKIPAKGLLFGLLAMPIYFLIAFELLVRGLGHDLHTAQPAMGNNLGWLGYIIPVFLFEITSRVHLNSRVVNRLSGSMIFVYIFHQSSPGNMFMTMREWFLGSFVSHLADATGLSVVVGVFGATIIYVSGTVLVAYVFYEIYQLLVGSLNSALKKYQVEIK
ncbi:acyltransferase family protein [Weissella confusa]